MPTTSSIQEPLLTDTVNFILDDIVKARVNGSVIITDLNKWVSETTLTVTYSVAQNQAEKITQVEFLDTEDNVLTSSTVYVPVDLLMCDKEVIEV